MTAPGPPDEKYMSFFEHLEELRSRLLRSVAAIAIGSVLSGIFLKTIFHGITRNIPDLYWHTPLEPYFTYLKIAIVVGLFISFPYVLFEMWRFVSPGLYQKERKYLLPFILATWILFVLGAVFVYFLMLPTVAQYLYGAGLLINEKQQRSLEKRWESIAEAIVELRSATASDSATPRLDDALSQIKDDLEAARRANPDATQVRNIWSVGRYVNLALMLFLAFGLAFDMPVVIVLLTLLGVVKPETLGKSRAVMLVLILIVSAVLTPTTDPVTQLLMAVPMYLLFEMSLMVSKVLLRVRSRPSA